MFGMGVSELSLFLLTALVFLLTLAWMTTHGVGLVLYLRRSKEQGGQATRLAGGNWMASFAGGFTGPLVILTSLVTTIVAAVALARARSAPHPSLDRTASIITLVAGGLILLMAALIGVWVVLWMFLLQ